MASSPTRLRPRSWVYGLSKMVPKLRGLAYCPACCAEASLHFRELSELYRAFSELPGRPEENRS